jgi:ribosomal protein L37AE/L43A
MEDDERCDLKVEAIIEKFPLPECPSCPKFKEDSDGVYICKKCSEVD